MPEKVVAARRKDGTFVTSEPMDEEAAQAELERVLEEVQAGGNPSHFVRLGKQAGVKANEVDQVELQAPGSYLG